MNINQGIKNLFLLICIILFSNCDLIIGLDERKNALPLTGGDISEEADWKTEDNQWQEELDIMENQIEGEIVNEDELNVEDGDAEADDIITEGELFDTQSDDWVISETIDEIPEENAGDAPDTIITFAPPNPSDENFAAFEFMCSKSVCTFECRLDGSGWIECVSPQIYISLSNGNHTFEVRAIDSSNNVDPTPASYSWTVNAINLVAISAGFTHTCAINRSGVIKCWGRNEYGQLGNGTTVDSPTPVDVSWLPANMIAVSAGHWFTCALTSDGGVKCWGYNSSGQLGNGSTSNSNTPVDVSGLSSGVVAISAGFSHVCALTSAGIVKCWGDNSCGQIGDGTIVRRTTPTDVAGLPSGVISISSEGNHSCALLSSGSVMCWGCNSYGQLGDGTTEFRVTPTNVAGLSSGVKSISAEYDHSCALLESGEVKCWGNNSSGQIGDGTTDTKLTPVTVPGLSGVIAISAGGTHTCALTNSGGVKCWGGNGYGQLGDGTNVDKLTPVTTSSLDSGVIAISAGNWHTCALTASYNVKCWGYNLYGQIGDGSNTNRNVPVDVSGLSTSVVAISLGSSHTCAITASRGVRCWGRNADGQLGNGTVTDSTVPVDVLGLTRVTAIALGHYHTCAVNDSGSAFCWGRNNFGQLGNGTTTPSSQPVDVTGLGSGTSSITAGLSFTCALTSSGGVKCWGYNGDGQLGNGTNTNSSTPVNVTGLSSGVTAISAGASHICALTTGGGVKCWGDNTYGQLGNGNTTDSNIPVNVTGLTTGVSFIAVRSNHSCAILSDSTARCWGRNDYGQLGNGVNIDSPTPVTVSAGGTAVRYIAPGGSHTCIVTEIGSIKCWGLNNYGQLGDGTFIDSLNAVNVMGLTSGMTFAGSSPLWHSCAVTGTGRVKCWGYNAYGQLGNGTTSNSNVPVDVAGF